VKYPEKELERPSPALFLLYDMMQAGLLIKR